MIEKPRRLVLDLIRWVVADLEMLNSSYAPSIQRRSILEIVLLEMSKANRAASWNALGIDVDMVKDCV